MQNAAGLKPSKSASWTRIFSKWFSPNEADDVPSDVLLYAPDALRVAILVFLAVGIAFSIPYLIEFQNDTRLILTRLFIIALTALGAILTFLYAGRHYRGWVMATALVGISATLFLVTYMDGPNVNPHAAILVTYVIGAGLCLGRRGVVISSVWLLFNYLLLSVVGTWNVWPQPKEISVAKIQHENLSTIFFLMLILVPLLLGYMAKVERSVRNLKRASKEQEHLLQRLIAVQEAERKRIAHVLHEGPVQDVAALRLAIRNEASQDDLIAKIDDMLTQLRTISSNLHPATLDLYGLPAALDQLSEQQEQAANIHIEVSYPQLGTLDSHFGIVLFRIAQEALNNVRKHSGARNAWIGLEERDGLLTLEVRDDGEGFDVEPVQRQAVQAGHLGLATLRELALSVGGTLQIASQPGQGTTVTVSVPQGHAVTREPAQRANYRREESKGLT